MNKEPRPVGAKLAAQEEAPSFDRARQAILDQVSDVVARAEIEEAEADKAASIKAARKICASFLLVSDRYSGEAISLLVRIEAMERTEEDLLNLMNRQLANPILLGGVLRKKWPHPSEMAAMRFHRGKIYAQRVKDGVKARDGKKVHHNFFKASKEYLNTFYKYKHEKWGGLAGQEYLKLSDWAEKEFGMNIAPVGGRDELLDQMREAANVRGDDPACIEGNGVFAP